SAAIELAGLGIRVNAVLPGYMPTSMGLHAGGALEKAKEDSLLGSLSDPKEAARFVVFLAGALKVTGQVFSLENRIV
ncbi:MAG TPA: SDR family oxidoreductase, partial [Dissulfurispiraceae bacterium]